MPVEVSVIRDKNGHKVVVGRVRPGRYATVNNYSSGRRENISVHVSPSDKSASIYEFADGTYTSPRLPHVREVPLGYYNKRHLDTVIRPGQSFAHQLMSKSRVRGRLVFTHLPSHRGARTTLSARHR